MRNHKAFSLMMLLSGVVAAVQQVSVTLHNEYIPGYDVSMTCPNLLPGQCCTAPRTTFRSYSAHVVSFRGLGPWHIAAIWRSRTRTVGQLDLSASHTGCSGKVWRSKTGPGSWTWEMWAESDLVDSLTPATGASYIEMPTVLPPGEKISDWLDAEGVLGLAWGGGKWFSSPAASRLLGSAAGIGPKSMLRRDVRSRAKGKVYAGRPRRWIYPSYIDFNGTRYFIVEDEIKDADYLDKSGTGLNLTQLVNG